MSRNNTSKHTPSQNRLTELYENFKYISSVNPNYAQGRRDELTDDQTEEIAQNVLDNVFSELWRAIKPVIPKHCPDRHENGNCLPIGGCCDANFPQTCPRLDEHDKSKEELLRAISYFDEFLENNPDDETTYHLKVILGKLEADNI